MARKQMKPDRMKLYWGARYFLFFQKDAAVRQAPIQLQLHLVDRAKVADSARIAAIDRGTWSGLARAAARCSRCQSLPCGPAASPHRTRAVRRTRARFGPVPRDRQPAPRSSRAAPVREAPRRGAP